VLVSEGAAGLLPAGPLRERRGALKRADAVAFVSKTDEPPHIPAHIGKPTFSVRFRAKSLVQAEGGRWRELPIGLLSGRRVAVVAAIADPAAFYATVRQWEAQIGEVFEFPDHHLYTRADWQHISRATRDIDMIVTTEKDLVKLEQFPFAKGKLVALRITPEIDRADALIEMVTQRTGSSRAA